MPEGPAGTHVKPDDAPSRHAAAPPGPPTAASKTCTSTSRRGTTDHGPRARPAQPPCAQPKATEASAPRLGPTLSRAAPRLQIPNGYSSPTATRVQRILRTSVPWRRAPPPSNKAGPRTFNRARTPTTAKPGGSFLAHLSAGARPFSSEARRGDEGAQRLPTYARTGNNAPTHLPGTLRANRCHARRPSPQPRPGPFHIPRRPLSPLNIPRRATAPRRQGMDTRRGGNP